MYPYFFEVFVLLIMNKISEINIVTYKTLHTGGNIYEGGLSTGLVNESYHNELYIFIF